MAQAHGADRQSGQPDRIISNYEAYLFGEGHWLRAWERMGARPATEAGVPGYTFVVWAPNARRVSVVGDFNQWDGRMHPLRHLGASGLWELFVPGLAEGERYKFELQGPAGAPFLKADPFALAAEHPPRTASITATLGRHVWRDADWLDARQAHGAWLDRPMAVYEVHAGSWRRNPEQAHRPLTWRELAAELVPYLTELGFTHVELLPISEFPFDGSWGYQPTGYFAPTSRFGSPDDFRLFVDECHLAGIGVILDWVPGHFPKDAHGLAWFDGTPLFEHADPRQGEHQDWGTLVFNYARHEVRNFLLTNALYWLESFHADGLRVDAVASMLYLDYSRAQGEWIPNRHGGRENLDAIDFLRELNALTHAQHPGTITIAEESTAFPGVSRPTWVGGLGFTFKWNMGWMHDILTYASKDPIHRRWEHRHLTFSLLYAWNENFVLPLSHDEVVHGKGALLSKMPGDAWQQMATLRALYGYMYGHPGKKLLFMGAELGERREWNHDTSLAWHLLDEPLHAGLQRFVADLNRLYASQPPLHEVDFVADGFEWLDANDYDASVVSFIRRARDPDDWLVVVVNWTPVVREGYRLGVPDGGFYAEFLNSDSALYGGSNAGNAGGRSAVEVPAHGRPWSLELILPPLGALILKRRAAPPTPAPAGPDDSLA
jgi:1,4-alpha-glucan branching enzyme